MTTKHGYDEFITLTIPAGDTLHDIYDYCKRKINLSKYKKTYHFEFNGIELYVCASTTLDELYNKYHDTLKGDNK